ncbi:MAG: FAD-binding oxidoreductase [Deltaproteobacteria bacterium]|nr:FAD-binding oxidoreductase [Deltaproteobacteria bacterium]
MEKKKMIPAKLPPDIYRALEDVVGREFISQDRAVLECYSKFSVDAGGTLKKHMKDPSNIPACIVYPGSTEEVQAIMRVCNRYKINVIPFTNGMITFNGPTTPAPTVCVHVSRMNKVLEINEDTMTARVEAYVDYAQLQADAMKKGLWNGGTPLATTLCKLSSQSAFAGVWQTDHKFGTLSRNIVSIKVVMPTGDVLVTGSDAVSGMDTFWEYGPGPDLFSLVRGSGGTTGIVTEVVCKLHTWCGDRELPEPPAGRPSIQTFTEAKYDTAPYPKRHKLIWVEFDDLDTEIAALRKIGQAGIGIGLNATGVYNAYYCSQTQDLTLERVANKFFPAYNLYVISQGIVSEAQIDYEENIVRDIIAETGGRFLTEEYKGDVLYALAPWNLDCIRHVTGYRMNRHSYCGSNILGGPVDTVARKTREVWSKALNTFGETYVTDRGGMDDTPFLYSSNHSGRFWLTEADVYPDMNKPELLQQAQATVACGMINTIADKYGPGANGLGVSIEPITSFMPEVGPNAHLLFRKIRDVFDPNGICAAGRQIFTKAEYDAFPEQALAGFNKLRQMHGLQPIERK